MSALTHVTTLGLVVLEVMRRGETADQAHGRAVGVFRCDDPTRMPAQACATEWAMSDCIIWSADIDRENPTCPECAVLCDAAREMAP